MHAPCKYRVQQLKLRIPMLPTYQHIKANVSVSPRQTHINQYYLVELNQTNGDVGLGKRLEQSLAANSTWCVNNTNGNQFLCPKTPFCTSDYNFCSYATTVCNSSAPFRCANGTCVSNPTQQCCPPVKNISQVWCPHLNTCVNATNSTSACCSLNSSTPIYCSVTKTCVAHTYECCGQNSLVKCGSENKCAVANSGTYCF